MSSQAIEILDRAKFVANVAVWIECKETKTQKEEKLFDHQTVAPFVFGTMQTPKEENQHNSSFHGNSRIFLSSSFWVP